MCLKIARLLWLFEHLQAEIWYYQSCNEIIDTVVRAMNQESKQMFSTIQQAKLRQLELEVEALEKQIENNLAIEPKSASEKSELAYSLNLEDSSKYISNMTSVYSIDTQKINKNVGIKLVSEQQI